MSAGMKADNARIRGSEYRSIRVEHDRAKPREMAVAALSITTADGAGKGRAEMPHAEHADSHPPPPLFPPPTYIPT